MSLKRNAFFVLAALAMLAGLVSGTASTVAKNREAGPPSVSEIVITPSKQASVVKSKAIKVRVRSTGRVKVSLSAFSKAKSSTPYKAVSKTVKVSFRKKGSRTISLKLSKAGLKSMVTCGAKPVKVVAKYRRGKKAASRTARKTLKRDVTLCPDEPDLPNPVTTAGCDPIDPAACLVPFPSDYFTKPDDATDTNLRLDFKAENLPVNSAGKSSFNEAFNRNDGFSPNSVIVTRVPGIDTPAQFRENDIVSQLNIGAYDDPGQRILLIDTTNNQRVPIWAELDMVPGTPNPHSSPPGKVQGTPQDRAILIHPAQSLEYGRRYVVAVRNLTSNGSPVEPGEVFKYIRDDQMTANPQVEERRAQLNQGVFPVTAAAGIDRSSLDIAWDFTVASKRNLTERVLTMRTDAFNQLGDTNLADGQIQGVPPDINNVTETLYGICDGPGGACQGNERRYSYKKVTGTITVPCYMNAPGTEYTADASQADTPCASGSRLNYAPGTDLPTQKMDGSTPVTWEAPFTCIVPRTGENQPAMATSGLKAIIFGHGLMQDNGTTESLGYYPSALEGVSCGTDWLGLSSSDLTRHLLKMINVIFGGSDLSIFPALPDRTQQGYINTLYLARALAHADGFASLPEFQSSGNPIFTVDQNDTGKDLGYYGVSLGGINGGATTALAPDWKRATLAVPGMGFSTLLTRSTQFNQFLPTVYDAYTNPVERTVGIAMLQTLWDRGEPSAYAKSMLDGSLGTPPHQVLIQESFGDHQVANTQTETLARTLGATAKGPILAPGRIADLGLTADPGGDYLFTPMDEVDPFWNIPVAPSSQFNQAGGLPGENAVFMATDTGPVVPGGPGNPTWLGTKANPDWNIAPVSGTVSAQNEGYDPHQPGATSPAIQQMLIPFLKGQGFHDSCGNGAPDIYGQPPFPAPTSSPNPVPCPAPAIDYIRNGR